MASGDAGTWFRPKPGDQVLVAFELGDPRFPVVIGSLWSNADRPPPDDGAPGHNNWQQLVSRSGDILTYEDTDGSAKVELIEHPGNPSITLDSSGAKPDVRARGVDVAIVAAGKHNN